MEVLTWGGPVLAVVIFAFAMKDVLIDVVIGPKRKKRALRKACAAAPLFAAQLGLEYEAARRLSEVGTIKGTLGPHGNGVSMDVFPRRSVRVRWSGNRRYPIDLSTDEPSIRPDDGMGEFSTDQSEFDSVFEQRYASREIASAFVNNKTMSDTLVRFSSYGNYKLKSIDIDEYSIRCRLASKEVYDEDELALLLKATVDLATELEPHLVGSGS